MVIGHQDLKAAVWNSRSDPETKAEMDGGSSAAREIRIKCKKNSQIVFPERSRKEGQSQLHALSQSRFAWQCPGEHFIAQRLHET